MNCYINILPRRRKNIDCTLSHVIKYFSQILTWKNYFWKSQWKLLICNYLLFMLKTNKKKIHCSQHGKNKSRKSSNICNWILFLSNICVFLPWLMNGKHNEMNKDFILSQLIEDPITLYNLNYMFVLSLLVNIVKMFLCLSLSKCLSL